MADTCDAIPGTSGALLQKAVTNSATSLATSLSVEGNEGNVGKFQPFEWKTGRSRRIMRHWLCKLRDRWVPNQTLGNELMMRYDRYGKSFLFLDLKVFVYNV